MRELDSGRWRPRRIVHVTPFLWSGAGAALVRLGEAHRASGSQVTVVTTGRSRGGPRPPRPDPGAACRLGSAAHRRVRRADRSAQAPNRRRRGVRAGAQHLAGSLGQVLSRPGQTLARLERARRLVLRRYRWPVALDGIAGVYAGALERG